MQQTVLMINYLLTKNLIMKKYFFFLGIVLLIYSCSKDSINADQVSDPEVETDVRAISGVSNNGKWLVFTNQASYNRAYRILERQVRRYNFDRNGFEETNATYDYEPVLQNFENGLGHQSLRVKNLRTEFEMYQQGRHPSQVMPKIQDYGILDDVELALLSKEGVVQIGSEIKMHRNGQVVISTTDASIAIEILELGTIAALSPDNIGDVSIKNIVGGVSSVAPECSSEFETFSITETETGDFLATFQWAQFMETNIVKDLKLKWTWGDGTVGTTTSSGSTSHTFSSEGTYTVCLEASWVYEEEDPTPDVICNAPSVCKEILIENEDPCDEELLCDALQIMSFLPIAELTDLIVSDNNSSSGQLCASPTNIVLWLSDFCADIEESDIELTFNGQPGPCWATCDGNRDLLLKVGDNCQALLTIAFNQDPGCSSGDVDTGWRWISYNNDNTGISYRQQTKTKANWGFNRLWSKMVRKEFINGKWKRRRAFIGMENSGIVKGNQTCDCDTEDECNDTDYPSSRKYSKILKEPIMTDINGIHVDDTDPNCWKTDYFSGPAANNRPLRGTGSGCE